MVDILPQPGPLVTAQAPQPGISPQDIARPYSELADNLKKFGDAAQSFEEQAATQAGYKAVTKDADGNLQVQKMPFIGPASQAYEHAMKVAALAQGEGLAKDADIRLRQEFQNDPEGYLTAANAYRDKTIASWQDKGAPEVGLAIGKAIDAATTYSYRSLWNQKQHNDLKAAGTVIDSGIQDATDNLTALARGGDTSSTAFQQQFDKVKTLLDQKVSNPLFAYPKEQAAYDLQHLQGELRGQAFLHEIDQTYQGAPSKADGAKAALTKAQEILTDPSLKISQAERQQFYSRAVGEVHAQEALRRQDLGEARAAVTSLKMVSAYGGTVLPADIESAAAGLRAAGSPGDVARLYAWASRAPLNDDFGRQPLPAQTEQLNDLHGRASNIADAIHMQESGGKANASTSVTGARGGWQIQPSTFKQYALPGEDINNPADNERVGRRIIADLSAKAGGDPARVAVGYFSGAGNIAPPGSPTPYIRDVADPTGKTTSSYVADVMRRLNGPQTADASGKVSIGNPAESMWQQANRAHVLDRTAQASWKSIQDDWDKKAIRPSDDMVLQVTNAARAANDWPLLDQIGKDVDRWNTVQSTSDQPLPAQQQAISALQAAGNSGQLSPGQQATLGDLQRRYQAITSGLQKNPIATTVGNFPDHFQTLAPLDYSNPQALTAGLAARGKIAQFAQANWQSGPVAALDDADLNQMKAIVQGNDPAAKATVFSALSALPEDVRNATLGKLAAKGGPDMAVAAAAGSMMAGTPDVAQSIFRGQQALKTDKAFWPKGATEEQAATDAITKALPPTTFGLAARTDPTGAYATAMGMVKARYADLSAQVGDVSGKLNPGRLTQAVNDVTGGVLSHNGAPLIAPQRGMGQADFDRVLAGVSDDDLQGVTTLNGAPVTAQYLRQNAKLESYGQGRYLVQLNGDASHPVYAYTGTNDTNPQKFVLDLRGKQPAPADYSMGRITQGVAP